MMWEEQEFIDRLLHPKTQDAAYRELISRYKRPLYQHIRHLVFDHDDTDDVLQNTFIKVFRNLGQFKGESKLFSWIYRIATNEALSFLKTKSAKTGIDIENLSEHSAQQLHADTYHDGDEIQKLLLIAVSKLPEKQRLVFNMKYYQDLKYEEISEILGTSVGALKASYHHAVKKIEEQMQTQTPGI